MLDPSPEKLLVVGFIAFVVLGPSRLPEAARALGRVVAHLRRVSSGFQTEVRSALAEPTEALQSALGEWKPPTNLRRAVRDTVTSTLLVLPTDTNGSAPTSNGSSTPSSPAAATPSAETPAARADANRTVWEEPTPIPDDPSLN